MLVLALVSLILHNSMSLHFSKCFHCVLVLVKFCIVKCVCRLPSAFIALKPIMCEKRVYSAKKRVLAHSTSFLLKNAFKCRELLVLALVSLILHSSMRLQASQCFQCVETFNVQKTQF